MHSWLQRDVINPEELTQKRISYNKTNEYVLHDLTLNDQKGNINTKFIDQNVRDISSEDPTPNDTIQFQRGIKISRMIRDPNLIKDSTIDNKQIFNYNVELNSMRSNKQKWLTPFKQTTNNKIILSLNNAFSPTLPEIKIKLKKEQARKNNINKFRPNKINIIAFSNECHLPFPEKKIMKVRSINQMNNIELMTNQKQFPLSLYEKYKQKVSKKKPEENLISPKNLCGQETMDVKEYIAKSFSLGLKGTEILSINNNIDLINFSRSPNTNDVNFNYKDNAKSGSKNEQNTSKIEKEDKLNNEGHQELQLNFRGTNSNKEINKKENLSSITNSQNINSIRNCIYQELQKGNYNIKKYINTIFQKEDKKWKKLKKLKIKRIIPNIFSDRSIKLDKYISSNAYIKSKKSFVNQHKLSLI